jgi:hypothetical protein
MQFRYLLRLIFWVVPRPENNPKDYTQHLENGESFKSRTSLLVAQIAFVSFLIIILLLRANSYEI